MYSNPKRYSRLAPKPSALTPHQRQQEWRRLLPLQLHSRGPSTGDFLRRRSNRSSVQGNLPVPSRSGWRFRTCGRPVRKQRALRYADAHFPGFLKARSRGLFRGPSWALEYCRAHARAGACNPHGSRDPSLWPHVTLMYSLKRISRGLHLVTSFAEASSCFRTVTPISIEGRSERSSPCGATERAVPSRRLSGNICLRAARQRR
jgi:hypothetical protein